MGGGYSGRSRRAWTDPALQLLCSLFRGPLVSPSAILSSLFHERRHSEHLLTLRVKIAIYEASLPLPSALVSIPMRNSAYEAPNGRGASLADVLQNPLVTNLVRLFLIIIFSLGGYIWKTEMDHVNKALEDIRSSVHESINRQWAEINGVHQEVSQMNEDLYRILYRTNDLLYDLARPQEDPPQSGRPHRPSR